MRIWSEPRADTGRAQSRRPEGRDRVQDLGPPLSQGAAERQAFDAGQIDAVMNPVTGSAVLLPEAQAGLQDSSRLALSALDALPGEICVLDSIGTVVLTNRAWRASVIARAGTGLSVCAGTNFFAACRNVAASEKVRAEAVAAGLRQVLAGERELIRCAYICHPPGGRCAFMLSVTGITRDGTAHALVTRENISERKLAGASRDSAAPGRIESPLPRALAPQTACSPRCPRRSSSDCWSTSSRSNSVTVTYSTSPANGYGTCIFPPTAWCLC